MLSGFNGRGKLGGLHAGLILLTPLGHGAAVAEETAEAPVAVPPGQTPLEPPSSFLSTAFSAIKGAFSPAAAAPIPVPVTSPELDLHGHPAPPPPPVPAFKPMSWGGPEIDPYAEPVAADPYADYNAQHSQPPFDVYAHSKSSAPKAQAHSHNLTPEKIQKIQKNVQKVLEMHKNNHQRSSEDFPRFDGLDFYRNVLQKGGKIPLLPTPVVTDAELGVLSADLQPAEQSSTTTTTTTTSTTTARPKTRTTTVENSRRKKDIKYYLRGNRIVEV
ncbi:hypothetical protein EVAR_20428_1 [Eumeta japonica]|uniref:Uncharacterized protein n=1 Tax=Eumeta variegata TaxID=151549 RepID=A0A4C1TZ68_EUMVA|nr:hypothetical protein EVAR_20428_1 [Eumeta japonica]